MSCSKRTKLFVTVEHSQICIIVSFFLLHQVQFIFLNLLILSLFISRLVLFSFLMKVRLFSSTVILYQFKRYVFSKFLSLISIYKSLIPSFAKKSALSLFLSLLCAFTLNKVTFKLNL